MRPTAAAQAAGQQSRMITTTTASRVARIHPALAAAAFALALLLAPLAALADGAKVRAAIEGVLAEMERAVLAGDAEAYLRHVATDDAVFLQEQRMWAEDLKRHVPESFRLRIVDPAERAANEAASRGKEGEAAAEQAAVDERPHEFGADRAVFELEMKWKMTVPRAEGEAGDPRVIDRTVAYPVVFALVPTEDAPSGRWLYRGEHWIEVRAEPGDDAEATRAHRGENVAMCFPGYEEVSRRIVAMLPEIRAHVDTGFEQDVPHEQVVKIYPTMRHLQASIYLSYWDGLSGWNEPKESIKVLVRPDARRSQLMPLLAHEYGHVVTFEMGPKATDIDWWVLEGVAELAAEAFSPNSASRTEQQVLRWARAGKLAEFEQISDFRNTHKEVMGHVYRQGQHMAGYISQRFGRTKRNNWLRAMANGAGIDEASVKELGVPGGFAEIDRDWRAEVMRRAEETEEGN